MTLRFFFFFDVEKTKKAQKLPARGRKRVCSNKEKIKKKSFSKSRKKDFPKFFCKKNFFFGSLEYKVTFSVVRFFSDSVLHGKNLGFALRNFWEKRRIF